MEDKVKINWKALIGALIAVTCIYLNWVSVALVVFFWCVYVMIDDGMADKQWGKR